MSQGSMGEPPLKQQKLTSLFPPKPTEQLDQPPVGVAVQHIDVPAALTALQGTMQAVAASPGANMTISATPSSVDVAVECVKRPTSVNVTVEPVKPRKLPLLPPKWKRPVGKYRTDPCVRNCFKSRTVYWDGKHIRQSCAIGECVRQPSFGFESDKRPTACSKCKVEGMVDIVNARCPCGTRPIFGFEGDARPTACSKCKVEGMVDIVNARCPCGTLPSFGFESDKRPTACSKCKVEGMVDIVSARCPCGTQPSFGFESDKRPTACSKCKVEGMVDIVSVRCPCGTHPSFGFEGDARPTACSKCKVEGMVDIVSARCPCGTHPSFGFEGDARPTACSKCKVEGMVDIVSARCPCGTHPSFGFEGDARRTACSKCKVEGMVDIVSAHCASTECERQGCVKDTDSNLKYCISCAGIRGLVAVSKSGNSIEASQCLDFLERNVLNSPIPYRDRLLPDRSWERKEKYGLLTDHPRLHPDGYIPPPDESPSHFRGTIVEYHGDFYHGFPPWHPAHETTVFNEKWGPDLYAKTLARMQLFKDAGFTVMYIWGSDWKSVCAGKLPLGDALREL